MNNKDIDIVIIWVDGNDPVWFREFLKYNPEIKDTSNSISRFRDMGTLKYVFRSIDKFLPWVRRIHFITYGHKPEWLDINNPKINFLSHTDIFYDTSVLPVFNSSSIELNFLGIKGLAEKFIYFNDDMLIVKKVKKERFFKEELPVDFLIQGLPRRGFIYDRLRPKNLWNDAINNNLDIINKTFNKKEQINLNKEKYYHKSYGKINIIKNCILNIFSNYYHFKHYHHPQPYLRSTLKEVFEKNKYEILLTSSKKFRSPTDLTQYIYRYWSLVKGEFSPSYKKDFATYNLSSIKVAKQCIDGLKKFTFICVNDDPNLESDDYEKVCKMLINELDKVFPVKSEFEL